MRQATYLPDSFQLQYASLYTESIHVAEKYPQILCQNGRITKALSMYNIIINENVEISEFT